ncbi:hypothetical protein [Burkholderia sp. 22313]|uniref:hypothetical protein n=1 Tax=Burkholderia sp. 22313 TaxID=3453908 RepID=UPI003F866ACB
MAFKELDLYTTRLGKTLNDDIETFLLGRIDKSGADAVRAWSSGDLVRIHRRFQDFFVYMDAQKLRTPKGLDWILKHYQGLPQMELMGQMQALRQMHCTMWSECVREIVSAEKSPVKFLVSDHPVTIYHPKLSPDATECQYPGDPGVELVGSQTIFALDANHCLILTNLEYAEDPASAPLLSRRTNARFRGESMARTDSFIRGRELLETEVHAINFVLKSRAKKYVAASNPAWLYPEKHCAFSWGEIATILLPRDDLWQFGGEMYIGYKDGTSAYRDRFGRTSKAHELLTKPPLTEDPAPDAQCGCGSGITFRDCCAGVAPQRRPSWNVMSIRERNLALIRGITSILQLDGDTTWLDVRRNISDEQVRRIHELFAALWPTDTQLIELLPSPQSKRSRALYLGMTDARTVSTSVTGMLAYVDELVLVHPFVNANGVRPEFSPIHQSAQYREQTLRDVLLLMILEPSIRAGRVHLIPDPLDYDAGFRNEIMAIGGRSRDGVKLGPIDKARSQALGHDETMRAIKRLPPARMKAYILQRISETSKQFTDADIDSVVRHWKKELEADPLALLDPPSSADSGEFKILKGFGRETGLFIATLTGSFVYTDSDTHWARLHETDGIHRYEPDPAAEDVVRHLENLDIDVPTLTYHHQVEPSGAGATRTLLRNVTLGLRTGEVLDLGAPATVEDMHQHAAEGLLTYKLRASVPPNGFQRIDVSRLVLTFGRLEDVAPVRLALFLDPAFQGS